DRKAVPLQAPREHGRVSAGTGAAPCGEAVGGSISVALLAQQRLEGFREKLIDGRGTQHQAFEKRFHATVPGTRIPRRPEGRRSTGVTGGFLLSTIFDLACSIGLPPQTPRNARPAR